MRKNTLLFVILTIFLAFFSDNKINGGHNSPQLAIATLLPFSNFNSATENARFLTRSSFESHIEGLYTRIGLAGYGLSPSVFRLAMLGYYSLEKEGALNDTGLLTIIDFSKASTEKRFVTVDLKNNKVKFHTYVAHGRNTGGNLATKFSNTPHSNQSSLGFYVTGETYVGSKGYSLRLDGQEKNFNNNIRRRAVVVHAADYATESWIKRYGRLGRSQGCPALPPDLSRKVIDTIKNKTAIFTYYPDEKYLSASRYLQAETLFKKLDEAPIELTTQASL